MKLWNSLVSISWKSRWFPQDHGGKPCGKTVWLRSQLFSICILYQLERWTELDIIYENLVLTPETADFCFCAKHAGDGSPGLYEWKWCRRNFRLWNEYRGCETRERKKLSLHFNNRIRFFKESKKNTIIWIDFSLWGQRWVYFPESEPDTTPPVETDQCKRKAYRPCLNANPGQCSARQMGSHYPMSASLNTSTGNLQGSQSILPIRRQYSDMWANDERFQSKGSMVSL